MPTFAKKFLVAAGCAVAAVALAGPAFADTGVSLTVGPVPIPNVPVRLCVSQTNIPIGVNNCVATPAGQSVSLTVNATVATPNVTLVPPSVTPATCPAGTQGVAAKVFSGSAGVSVTGAATVTTNSVTVLTLPINLKVAGGGQTVTVYACAGISPGLP